MHTQGRALDIMIGEVNAENQAMGDQIDAFLRANKDALGLESTIWRDQWRDFSGNQSTVGGHQDHVHAQFSDQVASGAAGMPGSIPGMTGGSTASIGTGTPVYVTNWPGSGAGIPGIAGPGGAASPWFGNASWPGAAEAGGNPGAGAERWRDTVASVVDKYGPQMGITGDNRQKWIDAIVSQIDTESGGNPGARNPNDSNGRGGTQSVNGLLQYLPESYASSGGKLTGLPYMDPIGQIAGALFAPRNPDGSPNTQAPGGIGAGHGWGPVSTPIGSELPPLGSTGGGGSLLPGAGMPQSFSPSTMPQYGGKPPSAPNPGGGGIGMTPGGTLETAMNLGAGALDVMAPGAGQAAATGMKLANRAIQYAGQVAGIGISGLMETFLPTGASDLANNSWFTRIVGGLAGAAPALPNIAGGKGQAEPPLTPAQVLQQQASGAKGGTNIEKLEYNNNGATEDRAGADLTYHLERSAAPAGMR